MTKTVKCPTCEEDFELDAEMYEDGDLVSCPSCGADLEVLTDGKRVRVRAVDDGYEEEDVNDEYEE